MHRVSHPLWSPQTNYRRIGVGPRGAPFPPSQVLKDLDLGLDLGLGLGLTASYILGPRAPHPVCCLQLPMLVSQNFNESSSLLQHLSAISLSFV